jgi:hypothetical protein
VARISDGGVPAPELLDELEAELDDDAAPDALDELTPPPEPPDVAEAEQAATAAVAATRKAELRKRTAAV